MGFFFLTETSFDTKSKQATVSLLAIRLRLVRISGRGWRRASIQNSCYVRIRQVYLIPMLLARSDSTRTLALLAFLTILRLKEEVQQRRQVRRE